MAPDRLPGWVNRFAARNQGLATIEADETGVTMVGGDGTRARLQVPFAPMTVADREPIEAVLDHLADIGEIGMVLVRAGAHSVGICRDGIVSVSSTDTHYVQGRTAAGGWSQQRYARRRGNQLTAAQQSTAEAVARVLVPHRLSALIVGGDPASVAAVLADPRFTALNKLPCKEFPGIAEPRRAVLDEVAARSLDVSITIRDPDPSAGSPTAG